MKEEDMNERRRYEWMGVWMEESMNEKSDKNSWALSRFGKKKWKKEVRKMEWRSECIYK